MHVSCSAKSVPAGPGDLAQTLAHSSTRLRRLCFESFDSYSSDIHNCRPHDLTHTGANPARWPWDGRRATIARRHAALIVNGITVILQRPAARIFDFDLSCSCVTAQVSTSAHCAGHLQSVRRTEMPICSCLRNEDAPRRLVRRTTAARAYAVTQQWPSDQASQGLKRLCVVAIGALVWIHIVRLGSIRTNVAFVRGGSLDRRWFATHADTRLRQHQRQQCREFVLRTACLHCRAGSVAAGFVSWRWVSFGLVSIAAPVVKLLCTKVTFD